MALFRKFFYRKPPDGLLEISERVYVFDCCFSTDVLEEDEYKVYMGGIVGQLRDHFPDASFMVFNFRDGERQSQIASILSDYDMTVMDYPRHYEGCPLLTIEMIHHFLRSSESWLSLGQQNVLLMHCERGGWPVLAFMLAGLLIYRKQYTGEQKTLDMIYKQAPRELLQLLSPLNPLPSQLRYLHYVARRSVGSEWPPLDRALTLDCVILRVLPNFDGEGGCRPIFRIYGQDPLLPTDRTPKVLFATPKRSKTVRYYKQADCELVKIDIHCHIQGDVLFECISLDEDLEREVMMFRVMFNTAFIRSNILILNRDEIDILWDTKDHFPKDFRAEVLFSELDSADSLITLELPTYVEKEGLPVEAFAKVQEIFSHVDWLDPKADVALNVLQQINTSDVLLEKIDKTLTKNAETTALLSEVLSDKLQEKLKPAPETTIKCSAAVTIEKESIPRTKPSQQSDSTLWTDVLVDKLLKPASEITIDKLQKLKPASETSIKCEAPLSVSKESKPEINPSTESDKSLFTESLADKLQEKLKPASETTIKRAALVSTENEGIPQIKASQESDLTQKKVQPHEMQVALLRSTQSKIITQRMPQSSLSSPPSYSNSPQVSPLPMSRYHSAPSALGITALLHDHVSYGNAEVIQPLKTSSPSVSTSSSVSGLPRPVSTGINLKSAGPPPPPPPPPLLRPSLLSSAARASVVPLPPSPPEKTVTNQSPSVSPLPLSSSVSANKSSQQSSISSVPPPPPPPPPPPVSVTAVKSSPLGKQLSSVPPPPAPPTPPVSHINVSSSSRSRTTASTASPPTPPPPPPPIPTLKNNVGSPPCPPPPPPPPCPPTPPSASTLSTSMTMPAPPTPPPPPPGLTSSPAAPTSQCRSHVPPPPPPAPSGGLAKAGGPPPPTPGPPTAPPALPKGRGLVRSASPKSQQYGQAKKTTLKPLHWLKLTRAVQGSLWAETQKSDEASKAPEFDMSELESLFSAAVPSSDRGKSGDKSSRRASVGGKSDKVQLIDLRRAYNCEIMLTKVKIPLPDLMSSVLALDDSALDVDQVDNLIKFSPTKEEMELLKGYHGDKENLGKCEQFFLELMKVPRVESKLRVFSFKIQFRSEVSELRKNLHIVNSASEEIRNSAKLKRIMQTILSLGNALNQGTARGSAIGFRLDSLLKLADTRARNNKMTLMHYLCKVLAEKLPELLDFHKDLVSLEAATKIQLKYLAEEMQAVSKGLEKVDQELTASENDGPVSHTFHKTLKEFLSVAEGEVRSLASLYSGVGRNADALALYFGEDPARCPFEQVVSTLMNFVRMFERAHEENCKQLELEKKRAQKEAAENEKTKNGASQKESILKRPILESQNKT